MYWKETETSHLEPTLILYGTAGLTSILQLVGDTPNEPFVSIDMGTSASDHLLQTQSTPRLIREWKNTVCSEVD